MDINLTELTTDELRELQSRVIQEINHREQADRVAEQIRNLSMQLLDATGREMQAAWVQPTGAHDSYPQGWEVEHNDKIWTSLIEGNVWEPGISGWREVNTDGSPSAWVQPTGAHDAYPAGVEVLHNDKRWVSLVDGNVWEPGSTGAETLWDEVVVEQPEEPVDPEQPVDPEEPVDPEQPIDPEQPTEPETPEYPEWVQPTGGHDAYNTGDRVMFEGAAYECLINGNVYSPTGYPAGWMKL